MAIPALSPVTDAQECLTCPATDDPVHSQELIVNGVKLRRTRTPDGHPAVEYNRVVTYAGEGKEGGVKFSRYRGDINGDGYADEVRWSGAEDIGSRHPYYAGQILFGDAEGALALQRPYVAPPSFRDACGQMRSLGDLAEYHKFTITSEQNAEKAGTYVLAAHYTAFAAEVNLRDVASSPGNKPPSTLEIGVTAFLNATVTDERGQIVGVLESAAPLDEWPSYYTEGDLSRWVGASDAVVPE